MSDNTIDILGVTMIVVILILGILDYFEFINIFI